MGRQVAVAFFDGIEARLGAKERKPGRPNVRRDELARGIYLQQRLQQIPRIKTQDRPAVRPDVADLLQSRLETRHRIEARCKNDIVHLAGLSRPFVDVADLAAEDETDRGLTRGGYSGLHIRHEVIPQAIEAVLGRDKFLAHLREPARVGDIARSHHADALELSPAGQVLEGQVLAGRPGKMGMNMEVRDDLHAAEYSTTFLLM